MLRRLGAVTGAVLASLAFAASAQAAPSAPQLKPIPYWVCGSSLNISWTPSTPDPGGQIVAYRVDLGDLTAGTATHKYAGGLSTTIGPLVSGHHYVVRVRALQFRFGVWSYSASSADTFVATCLHLRIDDRYLAYDPFRWDDCWVCGLEILVQDDPVIHESLRTGLAPVNEKIRGVQLDARGDATLVGY